MTNAHVVAGEDDTGVQVGGGAATLPAQVLAFDRHDDIAVLRVPGLGLRPLSVSRRAALGHRRRDPRLSRERPVRRSSAGAIGRTQDVLTENAYGQGPVDAPADAAAWAGAAGQLGRARSLDASGRVLTTVFAATVGGSSHGGYGVANAIVGGGAERGQGAGGGGRDGRARRVHAAAEPSRAGGAPPLR